MKNNKEMTSTKLTILLTLKDREQLTYRWINYVLKKKVNYKILVADGGKSLEIKNFFKNNSFKNIEYIEYDYDINYEFYFNKLKDAISRINTEYLLFADNDDFYIFNEFDKYVNFLDLNKDYIGVRGQCAEFELFNNGFFGIGKYIAKIKKTESIEDDDKIKRCLNFLENIDRLNYYNNYYSIFRTNYIKQIYSIDTIEIKVNNGIKILLQELFLHLNLLKYGKIKVYNEVFYLRQIGTSQTASQIELEKNFIEQIINSNYIDEYKNTLNRFISNFDNPDYKILEDRIRKKIIDLFDSNYLYPKKNYREIVRNFFKKYLFFRIILILFFILKFKFIKKGTELFYFKDLINK